MPVCRHAQAVHGTLANELERVELRIRANGLHEDEAHEEQGKVAEPIRDLVGNINVDGETEQIGLREFKCDRYRNEYEREGQEHPMWSHIAPQPYHEPTIVRLA